MNKYETNELYFGSLLSHEIILNLFIFKSLKLNYAIAKVTKSLIQGIFLNQSNLNVFEILVNSPSNHNENRNVKFRNRSTWELCSIHSQIMRIKITIAKQFPHYTSCQASASTVKLSSWMAKKPLMLASSIAQRFPLWSISHCGISLRPPGLSL